ncbi:MAG: peptidoglycan binding domain-containing protein [Adlercreutzia sp.]
MTIYANDEVEARIADETAAAGRGACRAAGAGGGARQQACLTADAASLEARVPSDELAAEALAVGREDGGILARLAALATGRELKPRAAYAETAVESLASDIDAAIGDPRVDYGIVVEDGTASVTEGHDGFMVNRDELRRTLDELLLGQEDGSRSFVARAEHAPLRIDESAAQDACDAVNAAIADGARFTYEGAAGARRLRTSAAGCPRASTGRLLRRSSTPPRRSLRCWRMSPRWQRGSRARVVRGRRRRCDRPHRWRGRHSASRGSYGAVGCRAVRR